MRRFACAAAVAALATAFTPAKADMAAAERWVDSEFQPSALSREDQIAEMQWFIDAAKPLAGMEINVLSETIPTHSYESETLTKAFEEITGIKVNHQLLGEGEVVQAVQTQMQTGRNLYDGYINDSDLIGTHSRLQLAVNLTDWMAGEGKDVTNPGLDLDDFMGASLRRGRMASSTSCRISSSRTSTGSARTGSTARTCRTSSRPSTVMTSACRSTGRPMRTSPNSSPRT